MILNLIGAVAAYNGVKNAVLARHEAVEEAVHAAGDCLNPEAFEKAECLGKTAATVAAIGAFICPFIALVAVAAPAIEECTRT